MLNNREIASAIWIAAFLLWSFRYPGVRESATGVVRSFMHRNIIVALLLAVAYVIAVVWGLYCIGVWTPTLMKDSVFWFLFTGIAAAFSLIGSWEGESLLRHFAFDALKITILIEFLTGQYTFSLPAELVLVPVLAIVAGMDAVAESDPKYARVKRMLVWVQIALGATIIGVAVSDAIADWHNLRTLETLRSLLIAPILSVSSAPFVYGLLLYVTYENLFVRLHIGAQDDAAIRSYARRRLFLRFGFNLGSLREFADGGGRRMWSVRSRIDIDKLLRPGVLQATSRGSTMENDQPER